LPDSLSAEGPFEFRRRCAADGRAVITAPDGITEADGLLRMRRYGRHHWAARIVQQEDRERRDRRRLDHVMIVAQAQEQIDCGMCAGSRSSFLICSQRRRQRAADPAAVEAVTGCGQVHAAIVDVRHGRRPSAPDF
jgi:hypothetical protein